ncbi:hypothetical protein LCY76_18750 [Fictibacillus sp. KIGAM418]|uniref:Uncharacterized protein n=1 Tax=Fictibacillus marinisediminis TaxID=2878389 RepID=A0A9X1XEH6_9BACL|nr:hypothetical protein [Fictibacillus marinisediminis]MCK6258616.1 hypothetical protein [Fictibacillus marinisediminis]
MKAGQARKNAENWVKENASSEEWFLGAYLSGSTIGLADDDELPVGSDVDIVLVTAEDEPPLKPGKFLYRDTLLEATYLSQKLLKSAREVLSSYHLAGSFRTNTIIADPTGHLQKLQQQVSKHFPEKKSVRSRCENAMRRIESGLAAIQPNATIHEQVTSWLFPAGVTTHVLLVAAMQNPTVRLRYLKAREVLVGYGQEGFYTDLLRLLGCEHFTSEKVEHHLANLEETFDGAAAVSRTPFFFSTDITKIARPIAIDGSRKLIQDGFHREAVFWIAATFARCRTILTADAPPDLQESLAPAFTELLADLGIATTRDIFDRAQEVISFLPAVWDTANAIMEANPDINKNK